jgi:hypothetical protein
MVALKTTATTKTDLRATLSQQTVAMQIDCPQLSAVTSYSMVVYRTQLVLMMNTCQNTILMANTSMLNHSKAIFLVINPPPATHTHTHPSLGSLFYLIDLISRVYGVLGFMDRELLHISLEEFVKTDDFYQIQKGITEGILLTLFEL